MPAGSSYSQEKVLLRMFLSRFNHLPFSCPCSRNDALSIYALYASPKIGPTYHKFVPLWLPLITYLSLSLFVSPDLHIPPYNITAILHTTLHPSGASCNEIFATKYFVLLNRFYCRSFQLQIDTNFSQRFEFQLQYAQTAESGPSL